MEKLKRMVSQIAYTPLGVSTLTPLQLSLIPLLSFTSSLYKLVLYIRHHLYQFRLLPKHRLQVPVISVGNITWGGNGKTPMVEFLAFFFAHSGLPPLILTRGYGGGDEAKMLHRHLEGTSAWIGVGANRSATAARFIEKYGYMNIDSIEYFRRLFPDQDTRNYLDSDKIGVAILDDGMQHLSLWRDLEIVMVNAMVPWGNHQLLPLGPLREPLTALKRAHVVVIHHADLVSKDIIEVIESTIQEVKDCIPIYHTKMTASCFFNVRQVSCKLPLGTVYNMIVLCVSAIGFANSFVQRIEEMSPLYVDRIDFSDHYSFQVEDVEMIRMGLQKLQSKFRCKPIVVVTEKDYDRDPEIFKNFNSFDVLVLCSKLQIIPHKGCSEESFKRLLGHLLKSN